jgi:hypothetical protein
VNFDEVVGFRGGSLPRRQGHQLLLWSATAAVIDLCVLVSLSCVFALMFAIVVKAQLVGMMNGFLKTQSLLENLKTMGWIYCITTWTYLIVMRAWLGCTLGEWACDLRLGKPTQRLSPLYILQVTLRSTLILMTGVVVLPALSWLFGKDVSGSFSQVELVSLK